CAWAVPGSTAAPSKLAQVMPTSKCLAFIVVPPFGSRPARRASVFCIRLIRLHRAAISEPWRSPQSENGPYLAPSVRKRPHPQFLLGNLPQPGKAGRLRNQEKHDQSAHDHKCDVLNGRRMQGETEFGRHETKDNGQDVDTGRAKERAEQTAQTANNDHEQDREALIDIEDG